MLLPLNQKQGSCSSKVLQGGMIGSASRQSSLAQGELCPNTVRLPLLWEVAGAKQSDAACRSKQVIDDLFYRCPDALVISMVQSL